MSFSSPQRHHCSHAERLRASAQKTQSEDSTRQIKSNNCVLQLRSMQTCAFIAIIIGWWGREKNAKYVKATRSITIKYELKTTELNSPIYRAPNIAYRFFVDVLLHNSFLCAKPRKFIIVRRTKAIAQCYGERLKNELRRQINASETHLENDDNNGRQRVK